MKLLKAVIMSKAYTDINQSKKLAEILPKESADMYYTCGDIAPDVMVGCKQDYMCYTMCWSLAALLRELPETILGKDKDGYVVMVETKGSGLTTFADEPVDACYEMILKLHELKML